MPERPAVSVVMAAYNAEAVLLPTLESVLGQQDVSLEMIVVDDGSNDSTSEILRDAANNDARVEVFRQPNSGLTAALIRGCREAKGDFIARQDAGDLSLPQRFRLQMEKLLAEPGAVMCSSFVDCLGPEGEFLFTASVTEVETPVNRLGESSASLRGPSHHGAVMMRREAYEAVGGYRSPFYFAQDIDLWSRLMERGRHVVIPEVLYRARLEPSSLSGRYANEQRRLAELIWKAGEARCAGEDEEPILRAAEKIRAQGRGAGRRGIAAGAYFIGSCLQKRDAEVARRYFLETVANDPFHLKAWLKIVGLGRGLLRRQDS
ncbi:MAG: glycosyltransferase family 2 protein [Pseudomonadota bacterium]